MSCQWKISILLYYLFIASSHVYGNHFLLSNYARTFDIFLRELGHCPDEGERLMYYNVQSMKKLDKNKYSFSGSITLNDGLHNGQWARLSVAVSNRGSWTEDYFNTKGGPLCKAANNLIPKLFSKILKSLGYDSCPVPPGNYTVKNLDLSPDYNMPFVPLNKYRVRALISKNGTRIGCAQLIADVVAKH